MEIREKYSKQLADYLYKDMSPEEMKIFEEELKNNKELSAELAAQTSIIENLKAQLTYDEIMSDPFLDEAERLANDLLMEKSQALAEHESPPQKKKVFTLKHFYYSAAAVLLFATASAVFMQTSTEDLYKRYYKPFESASFTLRNTNPAAGTKAEGIAAYMNNNISTSLSIFTDIKENQLLSSETSFFLGLSYMANEDYAEAAKVFNEHLLQYSSLQPEVKWYLGLSYLAMEQTDKASVLFEELSGYSGKFGKKAKHLQRHLQEKNQK